MPPKDMTNWAADRGERWRAQLDGMEATLAPVDEPLVKALRLDRPHRIADVGCGGGATAFEIWRQAPQGSVVDGYDLSAGLVETARARIPANAAVTFTQSDIGVDAPPGEPYPRLTSRFGTMFFTDPPAAFRNLAKWLAPGGRFSFAVWGPIEDNPIASITRDVVAAEIELPLPVPDAPGPSRYADVSKLVALLRDAGFVDVASTEWRGQLAIGGGLAPRQAAEFALAAFAVADAVAEALAAVQEKIRANLVATYERHLDGGIVLVSSLVHIVTGSR